MESVAHEAFGLPASFDPLAPLFLNRVARNTVFVFMILTPRCISFPRELEYFKFVRNILS